jgi:hypothetical protein
MSARIYWGQTIGAMITSIVVFFLLLYVAAPIIESFLNLFGRIFVPERYGGGSEIDNPGFLTLAFRSIMTSGLSAYGAFMASFRLFLSAHVKTVVAAFVFVVIAWAGLIAVASLSSGMVAMPLTMLGLGAAPALFVAHWAWKGDF